MGAAPRSSTRAASSLAPSLGIRAGRLCSRRRGSKRSPRSIDKRSSRVKTGKWRYSGRCAITRDLLAVVIELFESERVAQLPAVERFPDDGFAALDFGVALFHRQLQIEDG